MTRRPTVGDDPPTDLQTYHIEKLAEVFNDLAPSTAVACYGTSDFQDLKAAVLSNDYERDPNVHGWITEVLNAYTTRNSAIPEERWHAAMAGTPLSPWAQLFSPLINMTYAELHDDLVQRHLLMPDAINCEAVLESALAYWIKATTALSSYTLTLELNVARVEGRLSGDSPELRFVDFCRSLNEPAVQQRLLMEYPVLARLATTLLSQSASQFRLIVDRYLADLSDIRRLPGVGRQLIRISLDAGDCHMGQSVAILHFDGGEKLVYKPRSLSIDLHFNRLLQWVNSHDILPPLRCIGVVSRDKYGWSEYAQSGKCLDEGSVERFFKRAGGMLAIVHCLCGVDFHAENVIASGEDVLLIDLEALFQPRRPVTLEDPTIEDSLAESVLHTGLLPDVNSGTTEPIYDISGLSPALDQWTPYTVPVYEEVGTDRMHLVRKSVRMRRDAHLPLFGGKHCSVQDHIESFIDGFRATYLLFLRSKASLLDDNGILSWFGGQRIRYVLRPTARYHRLLDQATHPDFLRSGIDHELAFAKLVSVAKNETAHPLISAELEDLQARSVPIFWTTTDRMDLLSTDDRALIGYFKEPGLDRVRRRIGALSEPELRRQEWIARSAILACRGTARPPIHVPRYTLDEREESASRDEAIHAATLMYRQLLDLAFWEENNPRWIGLKVLDQTRWVLMPLNDDLYDGYLGVVLALAYYGAIRQNEESTSISKLLLKRVLDRLRWMVPDTTTHLKPGLFSLGGGLIYTLSHCATVFEDTTLIDEAFAWLPFVQEGIRVDEDLDLLAGSAGLILALKSLHALRPDTTILDTVLHAAQRLLDRSVSYHGLVNWRTRMPASQPLTGFSHGASGFATALMDAYSMTDVERFKTVAFKALEYERRTFSRIHNNWPDYRLLDYTPDGRRNDGSPTYCALWCHGAAGIGLARSLMLNHVPDSEILLQDLHAAVDATLRLGFGRSHCLCHGDLGNLDVLLKISAVAGFGHLTPIVAKGATATIRSILGNAGLCGTPWWLPTPGLMMGLAGMLMGLLRIAEPTRVPSVLAADCPSAKRTQ